jgi:hypothetical protein
LEQGPIPYLSIKKNLLQVKGKISFFRSFSLTTIDANEIAPDDKELVGGDILGADHGEGGHDAHHVVDEEAPLPAKPVGYPSTDETTAHPAFQVTPSRSILLVKNRSKEVISLVWSM